MDLAVIDNILTSRQKYHSQWPQDVVLMLYTIYILSYGISGMEIAIFYGHWGIMLTKETFPSKIY